MLDEGKSQKSEYITGYELPVKCHEALNHPEADGWIQGIDEELARLKKEMFSFISRSHLQENMPSNQDGYMRINTISMK